MRNGSRNSLGGSAPRSPLQSVWELISVPPRASPGEHRPHRALAAGADELEHEARRQRRRHKHAAATSLWDSVGTTLDLADDVRASPPRRQMVAEALLAADRGNGGTAVLCLQCAARGALARRRVQRRRTRTAMKRGRKAARRGVVAARARMGAATLARALPLRWRRLKLRRALWRHRIAAQYEAWIANGRQGETREKLEAQAALEREKRIEYACGRVLRHRWRGAAVEGEWAKRYTDANLKELMMEEAGGGGGRGGGGEGADKSLGSIIAQKKRTNGKGKGLYSLAT